MGWIIYLQLSRFWTPPRFLQGTTWLKSHLFALVNRVKHPIFEPNNPLLVNNPHVLVPFLEHELYIDGRVPDFSSFTSPKLLATHVPFASLLKLVQDSKTKLVYSCRNPRDTFISMWHFTNNLLRHHNDTILLKKCLIFSVRG
uniref:Sulfotransferase n=1 Tax=Solanum lycopersicum TaxID=4081 RepID=K4CZ39_SOLLC